MAIYLEPRRTVLGHRSPGNPAATCGKPLCRKRLFPPGSSIPGKISPREVRLYDDRMRLLLLLSPPLTPAPLTSPAPFFDPVTTPTLQKEDLIDFRATERVVASVPTRKPPRNTSSHPPPRFPPTPPPTPATQPLSYPSLPPPPVPSSESQTPPSPPPTPPDPPSPPLPPPFNGIGMGIAMPLPLVEGAVDECGKLFLRHLSLFIISVLFFLCMPFSFPRR